MAYRSIFLRSKYLFIMQNPKLNYFFVRYCRRIPHLWNSLIGDSSNFSLESRIFHSISLSLMVLAACYIPYNLVAGLKVAAVSCLLIGTVFLHQFYFSRFRNKPHSNVIFGITGLFIFSVNYFSNAGISGSTDLIWPSYLLLVFAISPYGQYLAWLSTYVIVFILIHLAEYLDPSLVSHPFVQGKGQVLDRITAFPIPVLAIYIIIKFIRKNYDKERSEVSEKTKSIELRNEQILEQKEQLEKSNAEKSKLMSIISHDLRAPLVNIQNYLELLSEDQLDSQDREMLENSLKDATRDTINMLSNLLNWSRTQMTGPVVHLTALNLLGTLLPTLEMERSLAAVKKIDLRWDIASGLTATGDKDMLELVIRNLISNAIKFTRPNGHILIRGSISGADCKLEVNDNGVGIPSDKRADLFSPVTEPAYGTENERGIGLGLVLCKDFMERQGGRLNYESTVGTGSSFFIFLPLSEQVPNLPDRAR
ncbi:sensor histidine kinase [Mucilaginibacter rubeus]|nr:HAMP domain-containing sensor histidine kinase [Mucilaginibacter rubeus]